MTPVIGRSHCTVLLTLGKDQFCFSFHLIYVGLTTEIHLQQYKLLLVSLIASVFLINQAIKRKGNQERKPDGLVSLNMIAGDMADSCKRRLSDL